MKQKNHILKRALGLMMLFCLSAVWLYAAAPSLAETRYGSYTAVAAPSMTLTKTDETCPSNGTITITMNDVPAGAGVVYEYWDNANPGTVTTTTALISGLPAATYTVKAYVTNGGSTQTFEQSITIANTYKPIIASSTTTKTCPGGSTGSIMVTTSQGAPASYEIISAPAAYTNPLPYNQTSNVFTGLPEGVYQIRVYDACGLYNTITATIATAPNLSSYLGSFALTNCTTGNYRHNAGHWAFPVTIHTVVKEGSTTAGTVIADNNNTYNLGDAQVTPAGTDWYNIDQTINFFNATYTFPIRMEITITDACGRVYNFVDVRKQELLLESLCNPNTGFKWDITTWGSATVYDRKPNSVYPITVSWVNTADPSDAGSVVENTAWSGNVTGLTVGATYNVTITDACGKIRTGTVTVETTPLNTGQTAFITPMPTCRDGYWMLKIGTKPPVAGTSTEHNQKITRINIISSPSGGPTPGSDINPNLALWEYTGGLYIEGHYVIDVYMGCVVHRIEFDAPGYGTQLVSADVTPSTTCNTANVAINYTFIKDGVPMTGTGDYQPSQFRYALSPTGVFPAPSDFQASNTFLNVPNGTYDIYMTFSRTGGTACNNKLMGQVTINNTGPQIGSPYGFMCQSGANAGKFGVIVSATGTGTLEYAITNINGTPVASPMWQSSNEFNGLDQGVYTITVRDNCATTSTVFSTYAISQPRVRTTGLCPNQDGSIYVPYVPSFTYQWYKDGTALADGGNISGATTNRLSFAPFTVADEGEYTVHITYGDCIDQDFSITISGASPNSGADYTSGDICLDTITQPIDLSIYLSADAQPNGEWVYESGTGGTLTDNMFDVTGIDVSSGPFVFKYITKGYCNLKDEAVITLNFVECVCYENPNTTGTGTDSKVGITLLKRAGAGNTDNWPMVRKSAHLVLESNTKGFVITRLETSELSQITNPQEGMMVYDKTEKCLKIYSDGAWKCFSTPTCP